MVNTNNYLKFSCIPDGILIPTISVNLQPTIPLSNLSLNTFISINDQENTNEYLKLANFIIYKATGTNHKDLAEYIILNAMNIGKVENYTEMSTTVDRIQEYFPFISKHLLKDIVYRIWFGDYHTMI